MRLSERLPDFPWDSLARATALANRHPDGIIDLSVGTPIDPVPEVVQDALAHATNTPGYPQNWGTSELRSAIIGYLERRWNVSGLTDAEVLPVVGTKEAIANTVLLLGIGPGDLVVIPELAYPTYEVGARLAGADFERCDAPGEVSRPPALIWLNSPANPHGAILSLEQLRAWIDYARETGAVLASDECYGEFAWTASAHSILDADLVGADHARLLVFQSMSKRSNLAGYRAGFIAGDAELVAELLAVRKHLGLMMPAPIQAAFGAALLDHEHVLAQQRRYQRRREVLADALVAVGFHIDDSQGGIYLWASRDEPCRDTLKWLAGLGILVAPGDFYGPGGAKHVRIGLTAPDERIVMAAERLVSAG